MASHEYDPDDNFSHGFPRRIEADDEDALDVVAWQFLLLVNPDDEDAALQQFAAFRAALEEAGEGADPALLLRDTIDWKAGFHVGEEDAAGLMEALDELASGGGRPRDRGGDAQEPRGGASASTGASTTMRRRRPTPARCCKPPSCSCASSTTACGRWKPARPRWPAGSPTSATRRRCNWSPARWACPRGPALADGRRTRKRRLAPAFRKTAGRRPQSTRLRPW